MTSRVVVVGGGVAGLTTAYRLLRADAALQVTVLESAERPGGKVASAKVGGLELETGPDSFVARKPWAAELCRELGLGGELVAPGVNGTYLWTDRGLVKLPQMALGVYGGLGELARWRGLSRRGRARAALDLFVRPRAKDEDESVGSLVRRRLGDEAAEMLVAPVLGGLFAGDVDRLSVRATFPELVRWERGHGSLILGARAAMVAATSAHPAPMFLRLAGGTTRMVDALVAAVGPERIRTGTAATEVRAEGAGFAVGAGEAEHRADAVVLATPAYVSSGVLAGAVPVAAAEMAAIPYASTAVVLLVYPEGTGDALPEATGFLVPAGKAPMTACTWLSRKWPRPEFGDRAVLRCYVGGVGAEDVLEAPDEEIVGALCRHLAAVLDLRAAPEASRVVRWRRSMPQYEVGHLERVARIEAALPPGMFVVGSAYRGVGIPDVVREAGEVAGEVLSHLGAAVSEGERVR